MKAPFFKRLVSYIIDIIIVSTIVTVICLALPDKGKESEKKLEELSTKLMDKEIDIDKYMTEYKNIIYDNNKKNMLETGINLAITVAYFVIFQYMNKGQTLGKKLLKIKVVDNDSKREIGIVKGLLRTLLIQNLLSSIVTIGLISFISKKAYINMYLSISEIESIFVFITAILVLYRKDGRGLHDMIANTTVIVEER